jgi:hypothetical protein
MNLIKNELLEKTKFIFNTLEHLSIDEFDHHTNCSYHYCKVLEPNGPGTIWVIDKYRCDQSWKDQYRYHQLLLEGSHICLKKSDHKTQPLPIETEDNNYIDNNYIDNNYIDDIFDNPITFIIVSKIMHQFCQIARKTMNTLF